MKPTHTGTNANNENWRTERRLFDLLDREAGFGLDAAADSDNALCPNYITKEDDAFVQTWHSHGKPIFLNHPYGVGVTPRWLRRARDQAIVHRVPVYTLSPASIGAKWMFEDVIPHATEVRSLVGRVAFGGVVCKDGSIGTVVAPFDSCVIVFPPRRLPRPAHIWLWDWRKEIDDARPRA